MFTRTRYQHGSLTIEPRKIGPDIWVYLYRETEIDGIRRLKKLQVGTIEKYPSKAAAEKAIATFRAEINSRAESGTSRPLTIKQLILHYELNEPRSGCINRF